MRSWTLALALGFTLALAGAAMSQEGREQARDAIEAGTAKQEQALEEAKDKAPDKAQPGIDRAREARAEGRQKGIEAVTQERRNAPEN